MPQNDPQQNTLRPDNKPVDKKQSKAQVVKDVISKGRTLTGQKPDDIIFNPVLEAKERHAVFAFGRFNPPTIGHEKLIHKVEDTARSVGGEAHIIASHTEGNAKNPLSKEKKVGYIKKIAAEGTNVSASSSESPTLLHHLARLHKSGVQHITMVAGDDRVNEFHNLINKYNGKKGPHGHFNFKTVSVVSAGHRDPDAEGTEGMSGTKIRDLARKGKDIKKGLPKVLHPHAKEIADQIRSVKEDINDNFDVLYFETIFEEIGSVYDEVLQEAKDNINYDETKFREDGTETVVTLSKHVTPGEPKSSKVVGKNTAPPPIKSEDVDMKFNDRFGKKREAIPRSGQERKDIDLVVRKGEDRKIDDRPYRQQSIQKKIIDDDFDISFGKGPPDTMSSPANDLKKQTLKLPKVGSLPWDIKKKPSGMPDTQANTPDMFKSEAYGKGYVSAAEKIRRVMAQRGIDINSDEHAKENERIKKLHQDILDREAKEKDKKKVSEEIVNSAGAGGIRGMGYTSGNPDGESDGYVDKNIEDADTRNDIIKAHINHHFSLHINNAEAADQPDSDTQNQIMNKVKKLKEDVNEDLRKWFDPKDPEGGWKRINSKGKVIGPCAREPGEPKPKCMSNEKRAKLSTKEKIAAVRAKRKHDPNAERKGAPINVSNFGKGKISEAKSWAQQAAIAIAMQKAKKKPKNEEIEHLEEKNTPTNPSLWSRAKALARSKFDVYPSAYANGWAAKWYKSKGGGWKSTNEEVVNEISNELIGKVNKIRSLYGPKSKTSTASDTLNKAVEKVRARTEVGKVKK